MTHVTSEAEVFVEYKENSCKELYVSYHDFVESSQSKQTAENPELDLIRRVSGLVAEAGEVVGAQEKFLRKYGTLMSEGEIDPIVKDKILDELGDTLFWVTAICSSLDVTIQELSVINYNKLTKRYPQGFNV